MLLTGLCPLLSRLCCLITLLSLFLYNEIVVLDGKTNFVSCCDEPKYLRKKPLQVKRKGVHALILYNHRLVGTSPLCHTSRSYIQFIKEIQSERECRP